MSVYGWKSFMEDEDRPEKPRIYGVTEMRGPNYTLLNRNVLEATDNDGMHWLNNLSSLQASDKDEMH